MKTRLLHLIFCVCAFHLAQVQSYCKFIHTDGEDKVEDDKSCFCGPEKIPGFNKTTRGPNSNSPNFQWKLFPTFSALPAFVFALQKVGLRCINPVWFFWTWPSQWLHGWWNKFLLYCLENWSLNPTERNWSYCCTSSTKSSCEIRLENNKTEKCRTNSKPHDYLQSCNGVCILPMQTICPDNPGYCIDLGSNNVCDGRKENVCQCSAPFGNSPFTPNSCNGGLYCGERKGAKFKNRQCYYPDSNHEFYQCLNRNDIVEDVLRTKPIYDSEKQVSNRKNYFQLFSHYNITNNTITCDSESIEIDCLKWSFKSINCKNGIYNELEICRATDFALHNGWIDGEKSKFDSYIQATFVGKNLSGTGT